MNVEYIKEGKYITKEVIRDICEAERPIILHAPTGSGKTTALVEYLSECDEQVVICSPLNSLAKQIEEKSGIKRINSETIKRGQGLESIIKMELMFGKSMIISLSMLNRPDILNIIKENKIRLFLDEAHLLVDHFDIEEPVELILALANGELTNPILMSATPEALCFLKRFKTVKPKIDEKSVKNVILVETEKKSILNILTILLQIKKENDKKSIVFMINNKKNQKTLKDELIARGFTCLIYNSEQKEVGIKDEFFDKEFDFLLCTTSLTTGISLKVDYISVCVAGYIENISTLIQFLSRNRNDNSKNYIITKKIEGFENIKHQSDSIFYSMREGFITRDNIHDKIMLIKKMMNLAIFNISEYNFSKLFPKNFNLVDCIEISNLDKKVKLLSKYENYKTKKEAYEAFIRGDLIYLEGKDDTMKDKHILTMILLYDYILLEKKNVFILDKIKELFKDLKVDEKNDDNEIRKVFLEFFITNFSNYQTLLIFNKFHCFNIEKIIKNYRINERNKKFNNINDILEIFNYKLILESDLFFFNKSYLPVKNLKELNKILSLKNKKIKKYVKNKETYYFVGKK